MLDDRSLAIDVGLAVGVVSLGELAFHLRIPLHGVRVLTQPVSEVDPVIEVRRPLGDDMKVVSSLVASDPAKKHMLVIEPGGGPVLVAQWFNAGNRFDELCDRPNLERDVDRALRHQPRNCRAADVMNTRYEVAEGSNKLALSVLELPRPSGVMLVEINRSTPHATTVVRRVW